MNDIQAVINGQTYTLTYNAESESYEANIVAPLIGGLYETVVTINDPINPVSRSIDIQVLQKQPIKLNQNKIFIWVFNGDDFSVRDILEVADYQILMDEETNATSQIKVLKDIGAKANDIIAFKKKNQIVYWGIIEEISNENGNISYTYNLKYITNIFDRFIELGNTSIMRSTGVEDFIKQEIQREFTNSSDTFANIDFITVIAQTHTPITAEVSNVENGIYNLHTYMTNCTQNYNIMYKWEVDNGLKLTIYKENIDKELIDTNAMNITNYNEVFETDITAKVKVITSTTPYTLYLKTDRTTTTNQNDPNRAKGKIITIYTDDYANAPQEALNEIQKNSYNHNITFKYDKYIKLGTPIAIKTLQSVFLNTYISSVKITADKFYEYQCGNIRINFIEKLMKERKK